MIETLRTILLMCLMLVLFSEYSIAQKSNNRKTKISIDRGGKSSYHWQNGRHVLKVEFEGDLEWLEDDSGIKSMTRGSYLEVEEKDRDERHYLEVEPRSDGGLEYTYRRNGKRQPFDDKAQAWFAEVIPTFIRESGLGAERRAKRIMENEGVDALLEEVDLISSSSVKVLYLLYMFDYGEDGDITGEDAARAAYVAAGISSPGDKARFLKATATSFFRYEDAIQPFFETVRSISSPGDKTQVLTHLVEEDLLEEEGPIFWRWKLQKQLVHLGTKRGL